MSECNGVESMEWLGCPMCGEQPNVETLGTWIEINCCVSMSRQKCDYLTIAERESWRPDYTQFCIDAEAKVLQAVREEWNTRKPNAEGHRPDDKNTQPY